MNSKRYWAHPACHILFCLCLLSGCPDTQTSDRATNEDFGHDDSGPSRDVGDGTMDAMVEDTAPDLPPVDYPPAPLIDGDFSEWSDADLIATDQAGDSGASFDITHLHARSEGTTLYVFFDIGSELNLQSGDESDGGLQLQITLPDTALTVDFRGQTVYRDATPSRWIAWHKLSMTVAPTYASSSFELRIDLSEVGAQVGDEVLLSFSGSDRTEPAAFIMNAPAPPRAALRPHHRSQDAHFRVASLNTLESGLSNPERAESIGRLLAVADADIYCFQEETETQDSAAAFALRTITGRSGWNVHKIRGTIIATTGEIQPVESDSRRFAAARVSIPGAQEVLIINYHGNCCGHAGSEEDTRRVSEAQAMVRTIRANQDVPAMVVGDWNLVGSRAPLTTVEEAGLVRWKLESLRPGHFWTWYSPRSRFTPGQLDILVHDPSRLEATGGYILSTHVMEDDEATSLGLMKNDSNGSDHQLLVADFR